MGTTRRGAIAPPVWLARRKVPKSVLLCDGLNQRLTTTPALGKAPASPAPKRNRTTSRAGYPVTNPVIAVNADHHKTIRVKTRRAPIRSPRVPLGISKIQYDSVKIALTHPHAAG